MAVLIRDLQSDSADTRERAVLQFLAAGSAGVPYLRQCLSSSRRDAAVCAAEALGRLGTAARPAMADLITASVDRDARMRTAAATALAAIDSAWYTSEAAVSAAEHIVGLLGKRCDFDAAREVLGRIGRPVVPLLAAVVTDEDNDLRSMLAAQVLAKLGPEAVEAIDALESAFRDGPFHVRTAAAEAIADIGQATPLSQVLLIDAIHKERSPTLCRQIVRAASRVFDPPVAAAVIVWSLADSEDQVHEQTARELTRLGQAAVPSLLRLMEAIPQLHRRQLDAIDQLLEEHRLSFRPKKRLSHQDFFVEATWKLADRRAAEVLRDIGKPAKAAVPMLISRIRSDDPKMRIVVAEALDSIAPDDPATLDALNCLAQDKNDTVRKAVKAVLEQRDQQDMGGK